MLIYILNFSACLAIFIVFYKLFLEKENMHRFKRFYLLSSLMLSIAIPLITFTYYVDPTTTENFPKIIQDSNLQLEDKTNYLTIILWSIYGIGVLIFGSLFFKNLIQIVFKINRNTKVKSQHFTNVLLQNLVIPHTFFNYIFLNKYKFETKQIPKEVLLHEETHATQKHSIDVLFIEILQVVFWFNPLLYFIKKDIKLNHEFLADQAVLNNGFDTSAYQNTLLAFSSPDSYRDVKTHQLANAINYSLIKKRFTVMKTQTSKKGIWLRSLLLLPLLAILLFSFSTKVIVLEEKTNIAEQKLTSIQDKVSAKQIAEYNTLAKKYNDMPEDDMIIRKKDLKRLKSLYGLMSSEQKKNAEPFPNFPPPPPTVVEVVEIKSPEAVKVIEVIEILPTAPNAPEASKVIKVREVTKILPPLQKNATPKEKKKYEEAVKNYKLKVQKVELRKIKQEDLIKVRELRSEDRKQLQKAKLAYKKDQLAAREDKIKVSIFEAFL